MINEILSSVAALAFVLALMALLVWGLKRLGLGPAPMPRLAKGSKQITIIESRTLDARNRLVIVRWRGREYLLGSGANGVTMIGTEDSDFEKLLDAQSGKDLKRAEDGHEAD